MRWLLARLGELKDASDQVPSPSLQDPAFDRAESGEVHLGQFLDERFGLLEARGDVAGGWPQGGCALVARLGQGAARVTQQRLAHDLVAGHSVGRQECLRFARA
jgi:hypothetical protein